MPKMRMALRMVSDKTTFEIDTMDNPADYVANYNADKDEDKRLELLSAWEIPSDPEAAVEAEAEAEAGVDKPKRKSFFGFKAPKV